MYGIQRTIRAVEGYRETAKHGGAPTNRIQTSTDAEILRTAEDKLTELRSILKPMGCALVAYSGGVDSAFLLKVAVDELGAQALAVTADSPTIPRAELEAAIQLAHQLGARHLVVSTDEMANPAFTTNNADRCYHCKSILFSTLSKVARERGIDFVLEGSNQSDLNDYRPGMKAAERFQVRSPLREARLTKDEIRLLSRQTGLRVWDKPAAPCLSSRIPYGSQITLERLQRIEVAEAFIRQLGFKVLRVRDHDTVARIEVPLSDMTKLFDLDVASQIQDKLKSLGFRYVTIDLGGFRSGSMNEVLGKATDGPR